MRELSSLGEKVDNFVYPVEMPASCSSSIPGSNSNVHLSGNSLSVSGIMNCHRRIVNGGLAHSAEGLWNHMTRLGLSKIVEEFDPVARIKEWESRDKLIEQEGKVINEGVPL